MKLKRKLKNVLYLFFSKASLKNENEIINKFEPANSYDKDVYDDDFDMVEMIIRKQSPANSYDKDVYDDDFDMVEMIIRKQSYGLCPECNQPNTWDDWCKECYAKKFQQNFCNWTSGNEYVDKLIKEAQLTARFPYELLEWIPYNRLRNIQYFAQGGFSIIYKAIWLDRLISSWDYEKQQWERYLSQVYEQDFEDANNPKIKNPLKRNEKYGHPVVLKSLNDSSNINQNFLNEWKIHLQCQHKAWSNGSSPIPLLGITQDPDTLNYMVVMCMADRGNLRDNLLIKKYNQNDKFCNLYRISIQLASIHKLNLVHRDFHGGNILSITDTDLAISDFGLCKPIDQVNVKNDIYGVLPYIAPEVLRGKPYTKAADIYSFGIIMWEFTSGVPAFHDVPHDFQLSLDICKGIRPGIIEGTMPEYAELMKRCWDNDPEKRPTAKELKRIFDEWDNKYPIEKDEEKRIPVPENEKKIVYHPKSCYTSRRIDYSAKLNEILTQDNEVSGKILIVNDNNNDDDYMSKSLADCAIED